MINFFDKRKANINSITIPDFGWTKEKDDDTIKHWVNPEQPVALSLNYFYSKPDIPNTKDINNLRDYYRNQIVQHNGGLIQVDMIKLKNQDAIKTIFKIPQQPSGMVYLASLTIPFKNRSYVIKIQALEVGMTGIRETVITDRLLKEKKIRLGGNGFENWSSDPYDSNYKYGTPMNKSEEAIYDAEFEDHPLTQVRTLISQVEQGIEFKSGIEKLKRFE